MFFSHFYLLFLFTGKKAELSPAEASRADRKLEHF
jgi:hypothetical protein